MGDETFVERKFIASLHRALEDTAPEQLEVFEKWFDPADRRSRFHIAPVIGAVGYLRKTPSLYREVMKKAGRYAAQWCCLEVRPLQRRFLKSWIPLGREHLLRRLLRTGIRSIHRDANLQLRRERGGKLVVTVSNSVFCRTSMPPGNGLGCIYYAAFFSGLLECGREAYGPLAESRCRARGDSLCEFEALARAVNSVEEAVDVEATVA